MSQCFKSPRLVVSGMKKFVRSCAMVGIGLACLSAAAKAQEDRVLFPGDAVTTGFAGITQTDKPLPVDANPLDHFYIDLDGASAQIVSLRGLGASPEGQRIAPIVTRQITARRIGQVFATAIDDEDVPNIFLGATSAYGLQIVGPDADGNGAPDRLRRGAPGAQFMAGQFGATTVEGIGEAAEPDVAVDRVPGPGTIWKIDGRTGEPSVFATLPGNTAPGIGDLVWDGRSSSLYVSDLENGLIHRLDREGIAQSIFDHGLEGRVAGNFDPIVDDGVRADITSDAFDSENPDTWGFTQIHRRVHGLAIHAGRLYYAVAGEKRVWSIGIDKNGDFAGRARIELDLGNLEMDGPVTDIAFDLKGMMYLAQRGAPKGSYSYAEFAAPGQSGVMRFRAESPDDPATPARWIPAAETYAIGLPSPYLASTGGLALGYGYGEDG
ncbi:MAG: hypothetical protein AAFZ01_12370, partial [Pseudomonadota bacterium]